MNENENDFTSSVVSAIENATAFANNKRYQYITVDNLMLYIADTPKGKNIFKAVGINIEHYKTEVIKYLNENVAKIPKDNIFDQAVRTVSLKRLLNEAVIVQKAGKNNKQTDEGYIFISLLQLKKEECFTVKYFNHFRITRFDIMLYMAHGRSKVLTDTRTDENKNTTENETKKYLNNFGVLLNDKAKEGKIDSIVGREEEISRVIQILSQRKKNNPLLIGEPGVGKTAIAEGLAKKIIEGNVPDILKSSLIYYLDLTAIVAGSRYRGDFEERLKEIMKEASNDPNVILFIDEIHTLIGAGTSSGTMDASNIMKPFLSSGQIKVIGATTYSEYHKHFEKDGALVRRFQKVDIKEPTLEQTLEILHGISKYYEQFHNVKYDNTALLAAVKLTDKYMKSKSFPDKAIEVIDIAGAAKKLQKEDGIITQKDISEVIAKMMGIPINEVEVNDKIKLKNLENNLKAEIFGQDNAIVKVVDNIILARSNLITKEKPIGSFFFAGPSGVGKTELSKKIAKELGIPLIRYDMSEYMHSHNVAKLIGTSAGYVGYNDSVNLIDIIRKTPYAVLLLDEIEKAHPDILNLLLQIMDYGVLTNSTGQKADFKNIILIMTSNAGAKEINKNTLGFSTVKNVQEERTQEIKKLVSPEFYNRLDSVIQFNQLEESNVIKIIENNLEILQQQLAEKKVIMLYTKDLVAHILKNGFDEQMGARPIARYIESNISQLLAKEILFGKLEAGGEIKIMIKDGIITFDFLHTYSHEINDHVEPPPKKLIRRKKPTIEVDNK